MNDKWDLISVFQHTRHDWLNRIQLIKGNLALGNINRIEQIIDNIVGEMQHEARLTNLNLPNLTTLMLTHNWDAHAFQIEYEVVNDTRVDEVFDDNHMTEWVYRFFQLINQVANPFQDNFLYITLEVRHQQLHIHFHYIGGIVDDYSELKKWLESENPYVKKVDIQDLNNKEFFIEVIFD